MKEFTKSKIRNIGLASVVTLASIPSFIFAVGKINEGVNLQNSYRFAYEQLSTLESEERDLRRLLRHVDRQIPNERVLQSSNISEEIRNIYASDFEKRAFLLDKIEYKNKKIEEKINSDELALYNQGSKLATNGTYHSIFSVAAFVFGASTFYKAIRRKEEPE